ncbi:Haloacid dehalogenase [Pyrenophora tritici-repentis]|uniref:Haloacid dehalogenase n=1 Tax=Pyrenophora tritici-repentis (strain Pt-1C-BFP) TaxID=426418 RepID=B2WNJ5_PYRTR|nr:haloacid dehalogenase [Pyrenophora tritici-repentis Pt-1C-BFP]EDU44605.1 haloacid dehalogenase [Pyrenophora tritici-repentis Pt-1C-BFP]KAI1673432.1 Haloacid dehalogenase [Pyrenophora tritici-repentis]
MTLQPTPRALLFDVFGTCVNWRNSVTAALQTLAHASLNSATASLASTLRLRASSMTPADWALFAQEWRNSYKVFTKQLAADTSVPWMSVDEHHLLSLRELLQKWGLEGLWSEEEVKELSLVWHRLEAWGDAAEGVGLLNTRFEDLREHSKIPFTQIFSAELFGTYKPSPAVYLGAVEKLGLQPNDCVMVAAHLPDLKAAKENGLRTVYVERAGEEDWSEEQIDEAREAGWVDIWVGEGGNRGFITMAERLGIDVESGKGERLSASVPSHMG